MNLSFATQGRNVLIRLMIYNVKPVGTLNKSGLMMQAVDFLQDGFIGK